jgi:hypothetical protein
MARGVLLTSRRCSLAACFAESLAALVGLRQLGNLGCKNIAKTRGQLGSDLKMVTAPFSIFFIPSTPNYRFTGVVSFRYTLRYRVFLRYGQGKPDVRAKRATTAGRQARAGENVPRTARPGLVACRWRSA